MITNKAVGVTQLIAEQLTRSGVGLVPYSGTPLWDLNNCTYHAMLDNIKFVNEANADAIVYAVANQSGEADGLNECRHDKALAKAVEVISAAVRADMNIARNVVTPTITSAIESVTTQMRQQDERIASVMAVVADRYEAIWSSAMLSDLIAPFAEIAARTIDRSPAVHPMIPEEQIIGLLKTGASRFDTELNEWINEIGRNFVIEVYTQYFLAANHETATGTGFDLNSLANLDPLNRKRVLIAHLMANRLQREPLEGISMSINDYELMMAEVYSQTGRMLNRVIENRDLAIRSKRLVIQWPTPNSEYLEAPSDTTNIIVNEDIYNTWLDEGGTPETLLGAAVSDRETDYAILLERHESYEQLWKQRRMLVTAQHESNRYTKVIRAINYAVAKEIAEVQNEKVSDNVRSGMHKLLAERLRKADAQDISDIPGFVQELVCDIIFPQTNARRILRRIDVIHRNNPSYSPREAASVAILDTVVEWVATLMDIVPCN